MMFKWIKKINIWVLKFKRNVNLIFHSSFVFVLIIPCNIWFISFYGDLISVNMKANQPIGLPVLIPYDMSPMNNNQEIAYVAAILIGFS